MAYVPNSGSVVAFQSDPSKLQASVTGTIAVSTIPSIYGNISGSVIAFPVGNQSVSGTVNVGTHPSIYGNISGSVVSFQGTSPWIVTGSVQGSFSPTGNQSVSGTVNVGNLPTNQNVSGSVVSFQGTNPWVITGSVQATAAANQSVSGTVGASIIGQLPSGTAVLGSVAALQGTNPWIITGSVQATAAANQSVSGTVGASLIGLSPVSVSNFPTNQNVSGSVVAFQGTSPWIMTGSVQGSFSPSGNQSVSGTVGASVIGNVNTTITSIATAGQVMGSVATLQGTNPWIITGSVQGSFSPSGNQSVSGTVGASIVGQLPGGTAVLGSVATLQGTNPWIITGSVQGSFSPSGNQSVSGTVGASIIGQLPAGTAVLGSVATLQGTNPWIITGSVQATLTPAANQSVSGTVGASIIGQLPAGTAVLGSITALQGTNPWVVNGSVSGTVGVSVIGIAPVTLTANTVPAAQNTLVGVTTSVISGSVVTVTGYPQAVLQLTSNPSMTGVVNFQATADGSDWLPITGYNQANNTLSSVTTVADSNWAFNVAGMQAFRANVGAWTAGSITGKVYLSPVDARPLTQYITGNPSISGQVGASIIGQLPSGTAVLGSVAVLQGTTPWLISSIYGNISGSVAATITNTNVNVSGSVAALLIGSVYGNISGSVAATITNTNLNVGGSVVAFQGTNPWFIGSIVGTYGEDVPSTAADKGLFTLGIRNDTVASLVGTDLDYTGWATDSAGRHLIKPFAADEVRLDTVSSVVSTSVTALFSSVTGLRNYVTDIFVANTGSVATLVTFKDGSTSVLGFTIAPAGGGSNLVGMNFPMRTAPAQDFTYTAATSSSVLYVTAKGYKAP
jgi:hypothetical protein